MNKFSCLNKSNCIVLFCTSQGCSLFFFFLFFFLNSVKFSEIQADIYIFGRLKNNRKLMPEIETSHKLPETESRTSNENCLTRK